jgi:putative phage-type endonuclease
MNRAEWLEARKGGIGGSDAPVVMGVDPWVSPYTLFLEKAGITERLREPNEKMYWGNIMEPHVADRYEELTGRTLTDGVTLVQNPEREHLYANTDRMILGRENSRYPGVYEGKTADASVKDHWEGKVPVHVLVQIHHYFYVCQLGWGSVACLVGGNYFVWADVERNERFIKAYCQKVDEFWDRVLNNDPPPLMGREDERRALDKLYSTHVEGKVVELDARAVDWADALAKAKRKLSEGKRQKEQYETLLRGAIGDAMYGRLPDGSGFKLAEERRAEHIVNASSSRVLRKVKAVA